MRKHLVVTNALWSITQGADMDTISHALVNLFATSDRIYEFLFPIIEYEVLHTDVAGTLFRGNSVASKSLSSFNKIAANVYLKNTLLGPISFIADDPHHYEVNPAKAAPGEDVQENGRRLLAAAQMFLDAIMESLPHLPVALRMVCKTLRSQVTRKFPESYYTVIGGYYFLRFICPAMIAPDGFGILEKLPDEARRPLILLSKILQNLSNGVKFGIKESYMTPLNDFLESNQTRVHALFDELAMIPAGVTDFSLEKVILNQDLAEKLHAHLYLQQSKIIVKIQEIEAKLGLPPKSEVKEFKSVLKFLETPRSLQGVDVKKLMKKNKAKK